MLKTTTVVALAALLLGVASGSASAHDLKNGETTLAPGRGVSVQIGGKHAVGFFQTKNDACHLTVVISDSAGGVHGLDSPGVRFVVPVLPGKGLQMDTGSGKSAEFFCGPGGASMQARVFEREPYKS